MGCSSNSGIAAGSGGSGGNGSGGLAGGTSGTNTGGIVGTGGSVGTGGTSGSGGTVSTAGTGGSSMDASPALDVASISEAAPPAIDTGYSNGMIGFYEAETPPAKVFGGAELNLKCAPACPGTPADLKAEAECCSGGGKTRQLLRGNGGLELNEVKVPADGMYDITWWYHCGENDNFGDADCGGEPNRPASGCRPHIFTVNGTKLPTVYEFHCFPGTWLQIHAATTPLPLKAGNNTISVVATTGKDAADMDAIAVYPAGKGLPPVAFMH